jgi:hypothetical protein
MKAIQSSEYYFSARIGNISLCYDYSFGQLRASSSWLHVIDLVIAVIVVFIFIYSSGGVAI